MLLVSKRVHLIEWTWTVVSVSTAGKWCCGSHRWCRWCHSHQHSLGPDGTKSWWHTLASGGYWKTDHVWRSIRYGLPSLFIILPWRVLKTPEVMLQAECCVILSLTSYNSLLVNIPSSPDRWNRLDMKVQMIAREYQNRVFYKSYSFRISAFSEFLIIRISLPWISTG